MLVSTGLRVMKINGRSKVGLFELHRRGICGFRVSALQSHSAWVPFRGCLLGFFLLERIFIRVHGAPVAYVCLITQVCVE